MASKKKEAEGIALLSMYNDEDMDPDDDDEDENGDEAEDEYAQDKGLDRIGEPSDPRNEEKFNSDSAPETTPPLAQTQTPVPIADEATVKSPAPQTPQPQIPATTPAPPLPPQALVSDSLNIPRARKLLPGIVDYAHDETAMSPEAEEGEILSSGLVTLGSEAQVTTGNVLEKTPQGIVHVLTPSIQATPPQPPEPLAEQGEQSKSDNSATMNDTRTEPEFTQMEVDVELSVEVEKENVDPLEKFLPSPPKIKCPEELQKRINKFLEYKKAGKSFNADLRNMKDYRNPDFLLHAVRYQDIDQIGTCFSKDVFDPHGYDKSDYYDEIGHQPFLFVSVFCIVCSVVSGIFYAFGREDFTMLKLGLLLSLYDSIGIAMSDNKTATKAEEEADMKRELERKEQERKKAQKVDFVSGGTQPGIIGPTPKINAQIPIASVSSVASGLQSVPTAADPPRDGRQNKKTKWDKVDGDKRPLHSGGQDSISAASAHAALLTAANAGAGYTAFAQQKRREAEEKRSTEKKLERRS